MLLSRDFVGYMANEVVKRLIANKMVEAGNPAKQLEDKAGVDTIISIRSYRRYFVASRQESLDPAFSSDCHARRVIGLLFGPQR
jgi:hypothetical protein